MKINLPELHPKQKELLRLASQSNPCQIITCVGGRRGGKSFGLTGSLAEFSFLQPKLKIWYITRSDRQVKEFFNEYILPIITSCPELVHSYSSAKGIYYVQWINGSRIEFKSSLAGNSLLGAGLDFCVIDEAAYVDEDVVNRIILPMFATKRSGKIKSKVILASSPAGTGNYLYRLYNNGLDLTQTQLRSVHFTVFDNPSRNDEWIELMRKQLTPAQYDQEVLGLFTDQANIFQGVDACSILKPQLEITKGRKCWVSCDIGLINDATTVFLLASKEDDINTLQVLNFWRLIQPTVVEIKDLIIELAYKYKPQKITIESNNQGLPLIQSLIFEHKLNNVEPFLTTQVSKSTIINNLAYLFNQTQFKLQLTYDEPRIKEKKIEIIDDPQLKKELKAFSQVPQRNGRLKLMGMGTSDDLVMGLAIGAYVWAKEYETGQYFIKVL